MENYKNMIKKIIIIILLLIILLVGTLFAIQSFKKKEIEKDFELEEELGVEKNVPMNTVNSPTMFYTIQNIVQKYLSYVHLDYEKQEQDDPNINTDTLAKIYQISDNKTKKEEILKLLDIEYVKENNINSKNLDNYIQTDTEEIETCEVLKMNVLEDNQFKIYSVYVEYLTKKGNNQKEYYVVTIDNYNSTFMIKPIKDAKDIKDIPLEKIRNLEKIESNKANLYSYIRINDGEMAQKYFIKYRDMMLQNPKEAYEKLSKVYREKRFGDYKNFEKYVRDNKEEIKKMSINQYLTNVTDKYTEYVCRDRYENVYTFQATGVMEYDVKLDTYTIESSKFRETYDSATEESKVAMNIDKWVSMLNSRDYHAAYYVLDETFRNENFPSLESFEKYMREQYPLHYKLHQEKIVKESNAYVRKIVLVDITGETNFQNENTIVMQLKEGREFVMSFYVRRH